MSAIKIFDLFKSLRDVTWGSIADGQTLQRSGTNIIGYTPSAGGTGDVVGPGSAADNDVAVFSGTTGKLLKTTAKPVGNLVTGPVSATDGNISLFNGATGKLIKDGPVPPVGAIVGTTDTQELTNKTLTQPVVKGSGGALYRPIGTLAGASVSTNTVGAASLTYLDYTVPAGLFAKDQDSIRIYIEVYANANANTKTIQVNFAGNILAASAGYNNVFLRMDALITRATSTTGRITWTHVRYNGATGIVETARLADYTIDFNAAQFLRVTGTAVASNDLTFFSAYYVFHPMP